MLLSTLLFVGQLGFMVWLTLYLKRDIYNWLLCLAAVSDLIIMSRYLDKPFAKLIICQLFLELVFGILIYRGLNTLDKETKANPITPRQNSMGYLKPQNDAGFTIIELLFATAAFTTVLLICSAGMIYIGRLYYKGVSSAKTQSAARGIIDDITRPIQFSTDQPTATPHSTTTLFWASTSVPVNVFCIGNQRYTYAINWQQNDNPSTAAADRQLRHALWRDTLKTSSTASCVPADLTLANPSSSDSNSTGSGKEMLPNNMRLTKFNIQRISTTLELYQADVWVVYGDEDLLNAATSTGSRNCKDGQAGTQFCALSELSSTVERRLK
jgi:hypothetical protein